VRAGQRKARLLVGARQARTVDEAARRVAAAAVRAQLAAVHIAVAGGAVARCALEVERRVAGATSGLRVRTREREPGLGMIERRADPHRHPAFGCVTGGARLLQLPVRVAGALLGHRRRRQRTQRDRHDRDRFHL